MTSGLEPGAHPELHRPIIHGNCSYASRFSAIEKWVVLMQGGSLPTVHPIPG